MRAVRWFIALAILAGLGWRWPLFHVVTQKSATAAKTAATYNPGQFAETFWASHLPATLAQAVPAATLLPLLQSDPAAAKKQFSRSVGVSDSYFYCLSGRGRVVTITDDAVTVAVINGNSNAVVALQTGLVFGDAVRDGPGWLNASDYPNSQDFNDLSAALNHLVETRVLPPLRAQAKLGATIAFAGCAAVEDEAADLKPLKVIPLQIGIP